MMIFPSLKPRRRIRWVRWVFGLVVILAVISVGLGVLVGWKLTHPARDPVVSSPINWGMPYQTIRFPSAQGNLRLHGWWIPATHPAGITVVLAHGYDTNREEDGVPLLAIAHALDQMGANVLMFDFRGEGRSPGSLVSIGYYEQWDLLGAVRYAHQRANTPVVVMGYSMGASTAILTAAHTRLVSAVIADSPFANLKTYLEHHLSVWTHLPSFPFNAIILGLLPPITHVNPGAVNPLGEVSALGHRPLLLIAGTGDTYIPDHNAIALYQKARQTDPAARLWLVPNANHVQAFKVDPVAYLSHIYQVLKAVDRHVRPPTVNVGF